jgi:hypothetical protein
MSNIVELFNFEPRTEEVKKKAFEDRQKINYKGEGYVNNDAVKLGTGEDAFDISVNKKKVLDNLMWLKSLKVEEFTFRKKWEEMQLLTLFIKEFANQAKAQIWSPTDLNDEELTIKEITNLQPVVKVVNNEYYERLWTTLRYYCSSAEYNQAPGRFIKFLMVDEVSEKVLGICSIASDVICISDRDKYIGWTPENKLKNKMLRYSAIGTTIVPTQPFGSNFLGGKLVAALVTSGVVRNEWEHPGIKAEANPGKLVGMTTTSLYGGFSMYNSLKWWKPVGMTKGKIAIKPYEKGYETWHQWLKQNMKDEYNKAMTQKEGISGPVTGAKNRVLAMIFKACGIKQTDYMHGFERGAYYSTFYENTKEFLCNKITIDKLVMKPLFKEDTNAILDWWKPKAIERYKKLKAEGRLNPDKLFYNVMAEQSYETSKKLFFDAVGR